MIRAPQQHNTINPPGQIRWCECGDRLHKDCPGEWEPGCDLGANEQHVKIHFEKPLQVEIAEYKFKYNL